MRKNKWIATGLFAAVLGLGFSPVLTFANETVGDKVDEAAKDTGRAVKKTTRTVKDKTCEMVNGKMECAGKKIKHKAKNTVDKVEDATD